jgi:DNA helicase-2/ATP-dependent DNA helicase PcrA
VEELLADFAIEAPDRALRQENQAVPEEAKPLVLSTIHSAKGLEWTAVFVIGLADGCLPVSFTLHDEHEIEEEHRLFYVAITRAKKYLFMSFPYESNEGGKYQFNTISRFIKSPDVSSRLEVCEKTASFYHVPRNSLMEDAF